jgi:hypothetical protein
MVQLEVVMRVHETRQNDRAIEIDHHIPATRAFVDAEHRPVEPHGAHLASLGYDPRIHE